MASLRTPGATVDRLLLRCLRASDAFSGAVEVDDLVAVDPELARWRANAAWHRVDPWAWLAIRGTRLADTPAGSDLRRRYDYGVARHLRMVDDLRLLATALGAAGIRYAVFKGAVLAELAYPRPDLRAYNDLDVLVAPAAFAGALDALQAQGCQLLDRNWRLLCREGAGQIHLLTPLQTVVDLHWSLLNTPANRGQFPIATRTLLERSAPRAVREISVPVLDPVDMLAHICLHACLAGANRLCWLKDIAQVIATMDVGLDDVAPRAARWRAQLPIGLALARAAAVFDIQIGEQVTRDLLHDRSWRWLAAGVDRAFPPYRTHAGGSVNRVVARAAGASGAATWANLLRRSTLATVKGGPMRTEHHAWEVSDDDPRSARFAAGSLAEYLSFVEAQPV